MWKIKKSALFKQQVLEFAENYEQEADLKTADRFLDHVEDAIRFIGNRPLACAVYYGAEELDALKKHQYRKWSLKTFPFSIFFRMLDDDVILLEAIYAHRMNIVKRMPSEIDVSAGLGKK